MVQHWLYRGFSCSVWNLNSLDIQALLISNIILVGCGFLIYAWRNSKKTKPFSKWGVTFLYYIWQILKHFLAALIMCFLWRYTLLFMRRKHVFGECPQKPKIWAPENLEGPCKCYIFMCRRSVSKWNAKEMGFQRIFSMSYSHLSDITTSFPMLLIGKIDRGVYDFQMDLVWPYGWWPKYFLA